MQPDHTIDCFAYFRHSGFGDLGDGVGADAGLVCGQIDWVVGGWIRSDLIVR
jgi:hypothetical protein